MAELERKRKDVTFRAKEAIFGELAAKGFSNEQIVLLTNDKKSNIEVALGNEHIRQRAEETISTLASEVLKKKLPMFNEIAGLSLHIIKEWLTTLASDKERIAMMAPKDALSISSISKNYQEILKLTEKHKEEAEEPRFTIAQTKEIFKAMKERDKVFDYPETIETDVVRKD